MWAEIKQVFSPFDKEMSALVNEYNEINKLNKAVNGRVGRISRGLNPTAPFAK